MKNVKDIEEFIEEQGMENVVILRNPDYATAFLGVTTEGQACYSYGKMVEFLMKKDKMTVDDAAEFVNYNTIRAIPYMGSEGNPPLVIYD